MGKLFFWFVNVAIAYCIVLYTLKIAIGTDIRSTTALLLFMGTWSGYGLYIGKKHGFDGVLSSWYTPFIVCDVKFCATAFAVMTVMGTVLINKTIAWDLAWCIVPTIPITLIALTLLPFFKGVPYVRTLTMLATFETLMIMVLLVYIFKVDYSNQPLFQPKSFANMLMIMASHIIIACITTANIFALRGFEIYQKMSSVQSLTSKLPYKVKMQIAVHEASHAVMYAYFTKPPSQFDIYLYEKAMIKEPESRGLVIAKIPQLKGKGFQEWRMLLAIAGIRGELLIYGNHSYGSDNDFQVWQKQASQFLAEHSSKYTPQPTTSAEMHINKSLESELFDRHTKIVDDYLKKNKSVVLAIAKQAMVFHSLESHHLHKHLAKIAFTSKFPREKSSGLFG